MNSKGKNTTKVAYAALAIIIALIVALFIDKITADDLWKGLGAVGTAAALFIGFLSKDATASHTKDLKANTGGNSDPDKEEK